MTLYTMYLTWSAMTNEPGKQLHKGFFSFNLSSFLAKLHHVLIFRLPFPISLENLVSEILKFAVKWTRLLNFKIRFCCLCPSLISRPHMQPESDQHLPADHVLHCRATGDREPDGHHHCRHRGNCAICPVFAVVGRSNHRRIGHICSLHFVFKV